MTYNGWENRATWLVNLWLTNEPGPETDLRMLAQMSASARWRADRLRDYVADMIPETAGLAADLLYTALESVDWREIVENHEHDDQD